MTTAHERILREFRAKQAAIDLGRQQGRLDAAAAFERRLVALEQTVAALVQAAATDDTRVIPAPRTPRLP